MNAFISAHQIWTLIASINYLFIKKIFTKICLLCPSKYVIGETHNE